MSDPAAKIPFNAARFLVIAITIGYFLMLAGLYFVDIPPNSAQVLNTQIGAVGIAVGTIVGYHFGSSSGSAKKTEMMGAPTTETTTTPQKVVTVTSPASQASSSTPPPSAAVAPIVNAVDAAADKVVDAIEEKP